jgi:hypothetical protein
VFAGVGTGILRFVLEIETALTTIYIYIYIEFKNTYIYDTQPARGGLESCPAWALLARPARPKQD